jgi:hypothetical protein
MIELEFICDSCGTPIADGDGSIRMSFQMLNAARRAGREATSGSDSVGTVGELLSLPPILPWRILHSVCRPQDDDAYEIDVERARTLGALDWWTTHLRSKNWLPLTDWDELAGSVVGSPGRRIIVKQPHGGSE